jgi:hypothetical protein
MPPEQLDRSGAAQEQPGRRIVQLSQQRRVGGLAAPDEPQPPRRQRRSESDLVEAATEPLEAPLARLLDHVAAGLRGEGCHDEVVHGVPSSVGERYESASAT